MNTKINVKQWAIASLAVFVILTLVAFVFVRLGIQPWVYPVREGQPAVGPDAMSGRIVVYLARLITAALFTFIFAKTATDKPSIGHGLRYGLGVGMLLFVPNFVTGLVYLDLSVGEQTIFMLVGVLQTVVCGATIAQLYKPGQAAAA